MVAIYMCVGPVPRGSELSLSSILDSGLHGVRNLRILGGQLMLVSTYLKTRERVEGGAVPRTIPSILAIIVILYLVLVRPLELHYSRIAKSHTAITNYERLLFVSHGARIVTRVLSTELNKVAQTVNPQQGLAHPFRWGVSIWRQVLKALYRSVVITATSRVMPVHQVENDSVVHHLGFGHHSRVGNQRYGIDGNNIVGSPADVLKAIYQYCRRWQVYTNTEPPPPQLPDEIAQYDSSQHYANLYDRQDHTYHKICEIESIVISTRLAVQSAYSPTLTSALAPGPGELLSLRPYIQRVTGSPYTKSEEQTVLLHAVVRTQDHILAVIPTGGGKSVSFLVPPLLPGKDITVVILPFRALMADVQDKMVRLGIPFACGPHPPAGVRAVILSLEVAVMESTLRWLTTDTLVRCIVVDEAHLALIWDEFRPHYFLRTQELVKAEKQVVLLTATVPFAQRSDLLQRWGLPHANIIAAPHTHRSNLRYTFVGVESFDPDHVANEMHRAALGIGMVGMVFVTRRDHTTIVAEAYKRLFGGDAPYIFVGGEDAPVGNYSEWRDSPRSPWIVATSALFHGVDHPHVQVAIFADAPDSVIDFQQASGRVARQLPVGNVQVMVSNQGCRPGVLRDMVYGTEQHRTRCRRWMISNVLDEHPRSCGSLSGPVELCDNCERVKVPSLVY